MPFKSKKQAAYMFAKHPSVAKEFAVVTPSIKNLPTYAKGGKAKKKGKKVK